MNPILIASLLGGALCALIIAGLAYYAGASFLYTLLAFVVSGNVIFVYLVVALYYLQGSRKDKDEDE